MGQPSVINSFLQGGLGKNKTLERLNRELDWDRLGSLMDGMYPSPKGRPAYPPLMMFKVSILQQWYGASDPEIEAALLERLSFRSFVGLELHDQTPDHSTISRFRKQLRKRGLGKKLFEEVNRQLDGKGLMVKKGTLVDATLVESQARRPSSPKGSAEKSDTDPDADWTKRPGRYHFGYKVHLGVDQGSRLIRKAALTPANVNDTKMADDLISGDEEAVYGDRAYSSKDRRERLEAVGIKDRTMQRANKHHPILSCLEQKRNRLISRVRMPVEGVFGTLKRTYGYARVRYMGLGRNETEMWFKCIAYNLRRADKLILSAA